MNRQEASLGLGGLLQGLTSSGSDTVTVGAIGDPSGGVELHADRPCCLLVKLVEALNSSETAPQIDTSEQYEVTDSVQVDL